MMGLVLGAPRAHAQASAPASARTDSSPLALPRVPEFSLTWPIAPLAFSFSERELNGSVNGPLQLFRAEALWWRGGPVGLWTVGRVEPALDLDCSRTCQPIVNHGLGLEARVPLPSLSTVVSAPYAFVSSSANHAVQSPRFARQLGLGLAGKLNF